MPGGQVFINYRHEDSEGYVGRIYDRLVQRFPNRIFRDVTGLRPGENFVDALEREGRNCHVLLAVIGRRWLTVTGPLGGRRLDDPSDILRQEIVHALQRSILVIPVLVGGAQPPTTEQLPEDIRLIGSIHALPITEIDFEPDIERLIQRLEQALGEHGTEKKVSQPASESDLNELLNRARSAIARQDWNTAIPALQSALVLNPADSGAATQLQFALRQKELADLFARGQALYERKDYVGALSSFQKVRAMGGNYNDVDSLITLIQLGPPKSAEPAKLKRMRWIVGGAVAMFAILVIVGIINEEQQPRSPAPIIDGRNSAAALNLQTTRDAPAPIQLQSERKPAEPVVAQPNQEPVEPRTSHITLRYLGDQLGGCNLHIGVNIGGRLLVPNSNPYFASDIPNGDQHYVISGAVVCPVGSCQAQGQGSTYIEEDAIYNLVWAQSGYSTCSMTIVPAQ